MSDFWNKRYAQNLFAYGKSPNVYLKQEIEKLPIGKALFAAAGEGRNAVYAASLGWETDAFDQSEQANLKATQLANEKGTKINYQVLDVENTDYKDGSFDMLALIYSHFPRKERQEYHRKLANALKPGGVLILEGFSKAHHTFQKDNPTAGGPKDLEMLYDLEELKKDFQSFQFLEATELKTTLEEGIYHQGDAYVIRILVLKP